MKVTHCVLTAMLCCGLAADSAWGQTLRQPASFRAASLRTDNYDNYYGFHDEDEKVEASPSDADVVAEPPVDAAETFYGSCSDSCDDPCGGSGCGRSTCGDCGSCFLFGPSEPFTLFPNTNDFGIVAGLWTQVGYHTQGTNRYGTLLMNDYPNRVQLQQQWFFLEKAVDTGGCGFDWGFRVDYVYGTDAPDTQAFGGQVDDWDYGWWNGRAYGNAIPQAYMEFGMDNLTAKVGKFYTVMGYESVMAPSNFFYSHAFEFYLSEPFTHTGALLDYKVAEDITVVGGWTAGWDTGFTRNGGSNFIGGIKLQLTDRAAFSYMTSWGDVGFDRRFLQNGSDRNGYFHTILFTYEFNERWSYVCQNDMMDNDVLLQSTTDMISWNNYLFYTLNDCWKFGLRYEWYKNPLVSYRDNGAADEINSLTLGLNYRPAANVVIRPEVRWDDFHQDMPLRDSSLFGIDMIFTY